MKCSEVYTIYKGDKPDEYSIEEYDQPLWPWIKSCLFRFLIYPLEQRWTQWFWHRRWYPMHLIDPETNETFTDWSSLCTWLDLKGYDLRNAKKENARSRRITRDEYRAHSRLARRVDDRKSSKSVNETWTTPTEPSKN